jgi:hypothetical protein
MMVINEGPHELVVHIKYSADTLVRDGCIILRLEPGETWSSDANIDVVEVIT